MKKAKKTFTERRQCVRHRAKTKVRVRKSNGESKLCSVVDLSSRGAGIQTGDMGFEDGERVELTFMVNLGTVIRMHHRTAMARYSYGGISGFSMLPKKSSG